MTSLFVLGAARSGVAILARAAAQDSGLPLIADFTQAQERSALGERVIALAPDESPDCPHLAALPEVLARRPDLHAVIVWRQGVDFVNSRLRSRPGLHFVDHCRLWAQSQARARGLHSQFPNQVTLIEFQTLWDRSSQAAERRLIPGFNLTSQTFAQYLPASAKGRTSLMPRRPVVDAARVDWSMGEVEAFAQICGPAMRESGANVDLAAAGRRRPLDLAPMFHQRAYKAGGVEIAAAPGAGRSWIISIDGAKADKAQLRLTALAVAGRRRLRVWARAASAPMCDFSCEIVEALTRRPLWVAARLGGSRLDINLDATLPANDGLLEFAMNFADLTPRGKVALELFGCELAYL